MVFYNEAAPVEFFIESAGLPKERVNAPLQTRVLDDLHKIALESGLEKKRIQNLARIVFSANSFDLRTRKKLLFLLMPKDEFPYDIIPGAVMSINLDKSIQWKRDVLSWLSGLMEYNIITKNNHYISICYPVVIKMVPDPNICKHAIKFLYFATQYHHVTASNIRLLKNYSKNSETKNYITHLLSLYRLLRPDMIIVAMTRLPPLPSLPIKLRPLLEAASQHRQEADPENESRDDLEFWPSINLYEVDNPHKRKQAYPQPQVLTYPQNLEERKELKKKRQALAHRKFKHLLNDLGNWKNWSWPNSASCYLHQPLVLVLFLPHKADVQIQLSHWLEFALTSELMFKPTDVKGRQSDLLEATLNMAVAVDASIPVIYHFLIYYLQNWDANHKELVLKLLRLMPPCNTSTIETVILAAVNQLVYKTQKLSLFGTVIQALTDMACNWLYEYYIESASIIVEEPVDWQWFLKMSDPLEAVWNLHKLLQPLFTSALKTHKNCSLFQHIIISYYSQINSFCKRLNTPLVLFPDPLFTLSVVAGQDPAAVHRLGILLVETRRLIISLNERNESPYYLSLVKNSIHIFNESIRFFLDSVVSCKSFKSDQWHKTFSPVISAKFYNSIMKCSSIRFFASPLHNLCYLSLFGHDILNSSIVLEDFVERRHKLRDILDKLNNHYGLDGILKCKDEFQQI